MRYGTRSALAVASLPGRVVSAPDLGLPVASTRRALTLAASSARAGSPAITLAPITRRADRDPLAAAHAVEHAVALDSRTPPPALAPSSPNRDAPRRVIVGPNTATPSEAQGVPSRISWASRLYRKHDTVYLPRTAIANSFRLDARRRQHVSGDPPERTRLSSYELLGNQTQRALHPTEAR